MSDFNKLTRDETIELLVQQQSVIDALRKDNLHLERQRTIDISDTSADDDYNKWAVRDMGPLQSYVGLTNKLEKLEGVVARGSKEFNELVKGYNELNMERDTYKAKYNALLTQNQGGRSTSQHFLAGSSSNHYHDHRNITNNYYVANPYTPGPNADIAAPLVHRPKLDITDATKTTNITAPTYSEDCQRERKRKPCSHRTCPYFHRSQEDHYGETRHLLLKNAVWAKKNGV
jgi:hypothetical protein